MNWMGGARNRIRYQGERRIQQEFFERQKLAAAQSFSSKTSSKKRKGLSQDLVALHTVSRVHSGIPKIANKRRLIQKLDLEKFRSCTRKIDEVDLGPCSPSETPSKLLLNDGKLDKDSGSVKLIAKDVKPSRELFPRPSHYQRCYNNNNNTSTGQEEQSLMKSTVTPMFHVESKGMPNEVSNKLPNTIAKNKPSNEFMFSKPKQDLDGFTTRRTMKGMLDPYVSEDFQVTPLIKYTKKRSPCNTLFENSKKRKCPDQPFPKTDKLYDELENYRSSSFKKPYFSSTPITSLHPAKRDKNNYNEQFGGISPINTGEVFNKDVDNGFRFKPRPMYLTPVKNQNHRIENLGVSQGETVKEPQLDSSSCVYKQSLEKSHSLHSQSNYQCDRYQLKSKEVGKYCKDFNNSEVICEDITQNKCTPFESECIPRSHLQGTQKVPGSLGKYRNIFRHKNELESPFLFGKTVFLKEQGLTKDAVEEGNIKYETGMSKPKFTDFDEEFHYKPLKCMKSDSVKTAPETMGMYKKFKDIKRLEDHGNVQDDSVQITKTTVNRDIAGGALQNIKSPLPGDEFPKYLLSPAEQIQDEIDRQLTKIIAEENKEALNQVSSHNTGLSVYKPLKTKIDDVLCEMKELEEQNIVSPESVLDKDNKSDEYIDVCTASFEADAFLESEEIVMETIRQHQKEAETGQNKESTTEDKTYLDITDMKMINNEITNDVEILADKDTYYVEILADKDTHDVETLADKDTHDVEKLANKDTDYVKILANKDTHDVEILADKDTHLDKQSVIVEIVTDDTEKETEVLLSKCKTDSEGDSLSQNSSTSQIDKQCQSQDVETKELNTSGCKEMKDEGKHVETNMEPCLDTCEKKDACRSKDIEMSETSGKLQVFRNTVKDGKNLNVFDKAVKEENVLRQVQVQEISSGMDQSTQTDKELETVKAVMDIGVQCDIPVCPSLASLAGKCYKVKPLKSSVSLKLIDGKDKE